MSPLSSGLIVASASGIGGVPALIHHARFHAGNRRDHVAIRLGERRHVIGRKKLDQFDMRVIKERARLQQFKNRAWLRAAAVEVIAECRDQPSQTPRSHRYEYSMAALESPLECGRDRVSQLFHRAGAADDYHPRSHRDPLIYPAAGPRNYRQYEFRCRQGIESCLFPLRCATSAFRPCRRAMP